MFESSRAIFFYIETPLHAGASRGLGAVDQPIQRDQSTQYPIIQAGGVKGAIRAALTSSTLDSKEVEAIFGPETKNASDHAGAASFGQARTLLFPVRSLKGVFAWVTCIDVLQRFTRDLAMLNIEKNLKLPAPPADNQALIPGDSLKVTNKVVLEEFNFEAVVSEETTTFARKLAELSLPDLPEYEYWKSRLENQLCILPDNAFRDFVQYSTEVQTHIRLDQETKTVNKEEGALWTTESLPTDSVLYAPIFASPSRKEGINLEGNEILTKIGTALGKRIQIGGNETTGQGIAALKFIGQGG